MQTVDEFFNSNNHFFEMNDTTAIAQRFLLPSAAYVGDEIIVFKKVSDVGRICSQFRENLLQEGYTHSTARTIAQSIPRRPHISAWVECKHFGTSNELISTSTARYFFERQSDLALRVQLVEYIQLPAARFLQALPLDRTAPVEFS